MLKMFSVYDVKAGSYGSPMFVPTVGLATRTFVEVCADPQSPMSKYPGDYNLFELGEFDPNSGKVVGHNEPHFVISAAEAVETGKRLKDASNKTKPLPMDGNPVGEGTPKESVTQ